MKRKSKRIMKKGFKMYFESKDIFVSKVYYRIRVKDMGLYILNSYKFNWIPKPFGMKNKYFIECGINWLGWILEFQWSK
jgi:hypothetical protein